VLADNFPALFNNEIDEDTCESKIEINDQHRKFEVLLHGVPLDLNTKVYWMQLNLAYPDNFVYICFHF